MANPNIDPVWSRVGKLAPFTNAMTSTANTALDGTGTLNTSIWEALIADATNGSYVRSVVAKIISTGVGVSSVLRLFINNGSTNGTATNNVLYREITIPAVTANQTSATPDFEIPFNILLPASYRILYAFGTAPVNLWAVYGVAGDL